MRRARVELSNELATIGHFSDPRRPLGVVLACYELSRTHETHGAIDISHISPAAAAASLNKPCINRALEGLKQVNNVLFLYKNSSDGLLFIASLKRQNTDAFILQWATTSFTGSDCPFLGLPAWLRPCVSLFVCFLCCCWASEKDHTRKLVHSRTVCPVAAAAAAAAVLPYCCKATNNTAPIVQTTACCTNPAWCNGFWKHEVNLFFIFTVA